MSDEQIVACEKCGKLYGIGQSPWCKDDHGKWRGAWQFARGQNTARNESFYAQAAADPFGNLDLD